MFPKTLPGRVLAFLLCIWGIFITSLFVVTLTNYVTLSPQELKALKLNDKLSDKIKIRLEAGSSIYCFCRLVLYMKREGPEAQANAEKYLRLLMQNLGRFKKTKSSIQSSTEGMLNKSDLVSMLENLHKSMNRSISNQREIMAYNDSRCPVTVISETRTQNTVSGTCQSPPASATSQARAA